MLGVSGRASPGRLTGEMKKRTILKVSSTIPRVEVPG